MAMLPNANAGSDMKPLFDCFLEGMAYHDLLAFIEAFPALLLHIYRWGHGPGGAWCNMPQLHTPQDVINWHNSLVPPGTVLPSVGQPLPLPLVLTNQTSRNWPIYDWMTRGRTDFLLRFHNHGLWNPLGYAPNGQSWFAFAVTYGHVWVQDYIRILARNNLQYLLQPAVVQEVTGIASDMNHLDYAINEKQWVTIWDWWSHNPGLHGPTVLCTRSQETLCKHVTGTDALFFLHNNAMNLAIQPAAPANPNGPNMPAGVGYLIGYIPQVGSPGRGSPWHLAVRNPNLSFLDFVAAHSANPADIDNPAGFHLTPVQYAWRRGSWPHFRRLIQLGADPGNIPERMIRAWPDYRDQWFRAALSGVRNPNPNPGGAVWNGTVFHWVLRAMHRRIRAVSNDTTLTDNQKRNAKRNVLRHGERLLTVVGMGNARGQPDLSTTDMHIPPRTPWDYARQMGYTQLGYLLNKY
ncbi:hypothetical protein BJX63DRAFT_432016 [Aspergillus granulosus]|uniref:Uncharacterized protein n=1 Tax=Aspergillus granulosus TaxID=176169 RepID=A0ABR4HFA0_9EURO